MYLIQYDMRVFQHVFLADQFPQQDSCGDKQNTGIFWGLFVHSHLKQIKEIESHVKFTCILHFIYCLYIHIIKSSNKFPWINKGSA